LKLVSDFLFKVNKVWAVLPALVMLGNTLFTQHEVNYVGFYGETVNKESYLKNFISISKGDTVSLEELHKNRINLVQLPKYGHVHLRIDTLENEKIDVIFELYEVTTIFPSINLGAIEENVFWQLGVGNSSSLGVGLVYNAFYRNTDQRNNYGARVFKPFISGKPIGIGAEVTRDATVEPIYLDDQSVNFNYTKLNFGVTTRYYFNPRNIITLQTSYFKEDYEHIGNEDIGIEPFVHRKSLYSLEYLIDKRSYNYFYTQGTSAEFKVLQVVNYDFDADFKLAQFGVKWFGRIKERHNLGLRFQAGLATNTNSPFAPFVLDSYLNIRGSGNRLERGTGSLVFNLEWRYTGFETENLALQGVIFNDSGSWRLPGEDISLDQFYEHFRSFSGLGLRLIHKKYSGAIFRADYGIDIMDSGSSGFVLGLGQYF